MPRIVKSIAVVDESRQAQRPEPFYPQQKRSSVIKGGLLHGYQAPAISTDVFKIAPKDAYLDELNRIKVEIEKAKHELRQVRSETASLLEPSPFQQAEQPDPGLADDGVWQARQQELNRLVKEAEEKASAMQAAAEDEIRQRWEQAESQGYLEGFQKGYDEATLEFQRENEPKRELLASLVERLSNFEQDRLRDNQKELVELVMSVASKVIAAELKQRPEAIVEMLAAAVAKNSREDSIRIHLAEDLLPLDLKASEEIIAMIKQLGANVTVRTAPGMDSQSIHLETPGGVIDMGVQTQLDNIRAALGGD